jgi:hypothetical protein
MSSLLECLRIHSEGIADKNCRFLSDTRPSRAFHVCEPADTIFFGSAGGGFELALRVLYATVDCRIIAKS